MTEITDLEIKLPQPGCPLGYTEVQIKRLLGPDNFEIFSQFLDYRGFKLAECTGYYYSYIHISRMPSRCVSDPHGTVFFSVDVYAFVNRMRTKPPHRLVDAEGNKLPKWLFDVQVV